MHLISSNNVLIPANICSRHLHQMPAYIIALCENHTANRPNTFLYPPPNNTSTGSATSAVQSNDEVLSHLCNKLLCYANSCMAVIIKFTTSSYSKSMSIAYPVPRPPTFTSRRWKTCIIYRGTQDLWLLSLSSWHLSWSFVVHFNTIRLLPYYSILPPTQRQTAMRPINCSPPPNIMTSAFNRKILKVTWGWKRWHVGKKSEWQSSGSLHSEFKFHWLHFCLSFLQGRYNIVSMNY